MTGTFTKGVLWRGSFVKIWSGLLPGDHGSSHWCCGISDIDAKQTPLDVYVPFFVYNVPRHVYRPCIYITICL